MLDSDTLSISHLFYVDDTLFLCEWDESYIHNFIPILRCFYLILGLGINILKSNLYGVGIGDLEVTSIATFIGCSSGCFLFSYLSILVGDSMVRVKRWQLIIDLFRKSLSSWKVKLLSIGGCFTLVRSVLGSLGIYFFSLFQTHASNFHILQACRFRFLGEG